MHYIRRVLSFEVQQPAPRLLHIAPRILHPLELEPAGEQLKARNVRDLSSLCIRRRAAERSEDQRDPLFCESRAQVDGKRPDSRDRIGGHEYATHWTIPFHEFLLIPTEPTAEASVPGCR